MIRMYLIFSVFFILGHNIDRSLSCIKYSCLSDLHVTGHVCVWFLFLSINTFPLINDTYMPFEWMYHCSEQILKCLHIFTVFMLLLFIVFITFSLPLFLCTVLLPLLGTVFYRLCLDWGLFVHMLPSC